MKRTWNNTAFEKWENETHIPEKTMDMLNWICEKIGIFPPIEETISLRSVYGIEYGLCKGFSLTHCTSSLADGPSKDYSQELKGFIKGLGFEIVGSHGDNGLDSATNWHDTFWTYDFGYMPTKTNINNFYDYPEDYDEEYEDDFQEEFEY